MDGKRLRLVPMGGPERRPFTITPSADAVTVGRSLKSRICLGDPAVSRDHAQFLYREGTWLLSDLGSRHGTHVNGTPLTPERSLPIASGDLVRFGPFSFRLELGEPSRSITTTEPAVAPGTIIERVTPPESGGVAERRLDLLIEAAAALRGAPTEAALSAAILEMAIAGTGYERGAFLRAEADESSVEIIYAHDPTGGSFSFSRSLLFEASSGHVARLSPGVHADVGQSIIDLGIKSALCAPVELDSAIVAFVYLDARGGSEWGGVQPDSSGAGAAFVHALARLAGLALADLKRTELAERQRRLEKDLDSARLVQELLGPPSSGAVGAVNYSAATHSGRFVAGDLFDLYTVGEHETAICFGDVCGQGVAAALLMTAMLAHLRASFGASARPEDAVSHVNEYIAVRSSAETFATLWVGVIDARSGALRYVDAGHGHWFIARADGSIDPPRRPNGLVIGIEPKYGYTAAEITVRAGDRIVLFSDGIIEARAENGEFFGREKLEAAVIQAGAGEPGRRAEAAVRAGMGALTAFLGGLRLDDDTTLAVLDLPGIPA